jgi:mono/diheme cytochrome c family protein
LCFCAATQRNRPVPTMPQPNFEDSPPPPLALISYEYLVTTMRDFVTEERGNNGDMPKFMQALTDSERDANGALSLRT